MVSPYPRVSSVPLIMFRGVPSRVIACSRHHFTGLGRPELPTPHETLFLFAVDDIADRVVVRSLRLMDISEA